MTNGIRSLVLGLLVMVGSFSIPSPFSIGIYWSLLLALVFGITAGLSKKISSTQFLYGLFVGYIALFIYALAFLTLLSFLLAITNLAILGVAIGAFFVSRGSEKNET